MRGEGEQRVLILEATQHSRHGQSLSGSWREAGKEGVPPLRAIGTWECFGHSGWPDPDAASGIFFRPFVERTSDQIRSETWPTMLKRSLSSGCGSTGGGGPLRQP